MKLNRPLFFLLLIVISFPLRAGDGFCDVRNTAFSHGEQITFKVFYTALGAFLGAGEASFTTNLEKFQNKTVYHITGEGKTYGFYDNFFKVRDKYESYIDTASLQPLRFVRNIYEGGYKKYENVTFSKATSTAITNDGVYNVPNCIQDVLSAIFYARNIDFDSYKAGDKITFSMFLDNEVYEMYIRYLGKENVKTKYGKFRAVKFKPLLIKGTIFEGGEKMTVWVSDDKNHIPVRIESPISVGSIKVDMISNRNLRYPLSSLLSVR
jgi:Protein of unknown function (DUF3108)